MPFKCALLLAALLLWRLALPRCHAALGGLEQVEAVQEVLEAGAARLQLAQGLVEHLESETSVAARRNCVEKALWLLSCSPDGPETSGSSPEKTFLPRCAQ